ALRAIGRRPLLGWGPDRTRVGLPAALPRAFEAQYWDQTVPDRAHNVLLDVGVTLGVPAAVLLLAGVARAVIRASRLELNAGGDAVWWIVAVAPLPHLMFNFIQLDVDLAAALV